jgi:hypothetical protein
MPTSASLVNELKAAQGRVKEIGEKRQRLLSEASVEEHKVNEALAKLAELGVENADKMSVAELTTLRDQTQASLEENLAKVKAQIAEADTVMAEYEAVTQAAV